jgi:hypothetical protein
MDSIRLEVETDSSVTTVEGAVVLGKPLACPVFSVPVLMRETGLKRAEHGTREEAYSGADCESAAADRSGLPFKKTIRKLVSYLEKVEVEALLAVPDRTTVQGKRNYALLLFLYNSGARASEAANLCIGEWPHKQGRENPLCADAVGQFFQGCILEDVARVGGGLGKDVEGKVAVFGSGVGVHGGSPCAVGRSCGV